MIVKIFKTGCGTDGAQYSTTLDGAPLPHFCRTRHHDIQLQQSLDLNLGSINISVIRSHRNSVYLYLLPLSYGFYIFYFIFSSVEKKSWWGKTELYRQSLTSPFHIKCCTIFCRQLSRIFLPVPKWTRLGRWYILENVVCFRFSCSSRGDNVHSLHQLSLRSYDGRTLCDMQKRALHCVALFKTLVIILRLKTNPFDVFNNDLTSKHVFEQSSVEVDTFLHLTHHHDHHLTRA